MKWSDVTLSQFIELHSIQCDSLIDRIIEMLSILTERDVEEFEDMTADELGEERGKISFLSSQITAKGSKHINGFEMINLKSITLDAFIDADYYVTKGVTSIGEVIKILYRKTKENEWKDKVLEDYDYDPLDRDMGTLMVEDVYASFQEFVKFRTELLEAYKHLFEMDIAEEDTDEDYEETKEEKAFAKWSWERTVLSFCNDDITKFSDVLSLPAIFVFNMMSLRKEIG